jgi:hypothetical protein
MQQRPLNTTRRFPRAFSTHPIRIRVLSERRPDQLTQTRIISPGGCMLVSESSIGFGSLLELMISLDGRLLRADGRVAWERRTGQAEHEVGIEFLRINRRDRDVLAQLVATKLSPAA